jgi:hypothetical protein
MAHTLLLFLLTYYRQYHIDSVSITAKTPPAAEKLIPAHI